MARAGRSNIVYVVTPSNVTVDQMQDAENGKIARKYTPYRMVKNSDVSQRQVYLLDVASDNSNDPARSVCRSSRFAFFKTRSKDRYPESAMTNIARRLVLCVVCVTIGALVAGCPNNTGTTSGKNDRQRHRHNAEWGQHWRFWRLRQLRTRADYSSFRRRIVHDRPYRRRVDGIGWQRRQWSQWR